MTVQCSQGALKVTKSWYGAKEEYIGKQFAVSQRPHKPSDSRRSVIRKHEIDVNIYSNVAAAELLAAI